MSWQLPWSKFRKTKSFRDLLRSQGVRVCRACGCTDKAACVVAGVPCHWVEEDLCSACVEAPAKVEEDDEVSDGTF